MVAPFLPTLAAGRLALSFTGQDPAAGSPPVVPPPPAAAETTAPPVSAPPTTAPTTTAPAMATGEEVAPLERTRRAEGPEAPPAGPLRATDRRFFFSLFVGGARSLRSGSYSSLYGGGSDLKIEAALGGHGKLRPNLAGAAVLQVTTGFPLTTFTLMPRLQIDRPISEAYAIYFTSVFQVGYRFGLAFEGGDEYYGGGGLYMTHSGVAGVGFGASMILAERLLLSFRPANFEIVAPSLERIVDVRWDAIGGIGVVW